MNHPCQICGTEVAESDACGDHNAATGEHDYFCPDCYGDRIGTAECPLCANEKAWSDIGDDYLHHAGGVHCRYVTFRFVSRQCGMQNQYCSRYVKTHGHGLRFRNWPNMGGDYHAIQIHRDDVDTFVERVQTHRRETGQIA